MKFENVSASYDVGIAKELGLASAILLNKIMYLSKYTSREDGYCWRTAKELEDELGLSQYQQKLAIQKLEEAGIIETKNTYIIGTQIKCKHFRIIDKSGLEETNKCDLSEINKCDLQETYKSDLEETNKSVNNNKTIIIKHNNKTIKEYYQDKELNDLFNDYLDLRKKIKAVNSERAINTLIKKLEPYNDIIKKQMLNESIVNSWKSVYPIKEKEKTGWELLK